MCVFVIWPRCVLVCVHRSVHAICAYNVKIVVNKHTYIHRCIKHIHIWYSATKTDTHEASKKFWTKSENTCLPSSLHNPPYSWCEFCALSYSETKHTKKRQSKNVCRAVDIIYFLLASESIEFFPSQFCLEPMLNVHVLVKKIYFLKNVLWKPILSMIFTSFPSSCFNNWSKTPRKLNKWYSIINENNNLKRIHWGRCVVRTNTPTVNNECCLCWKQRSHHTYYAKQQSKSSSTEYSRNERTYKMSKHTKRVSLLLLLSAW